MRHCDFIKDTGSTISILAEGDDNVVMYQSNALGWKGLIDTMVELFSTINNEKQDLYPSILRQELPPSYEASQNESTPPPYLTMNQNHYSSHESRTSPSPNN